MSQAFGYNAFFGWKKETTYGTAATPPNKWAECESIAVSDDRKQIHKPLLGHVSRRRVVRGKHAPGVTLKMPFNCEGLEQLFEAALGSVSTGSISGGVYPHTFSLAADLPVGLTAYVDIDEAAISGDHVQQIIGCQIDKLTLTQEMDQTLDVEVEMIGRDFVDVARTSPTLPTYDAFDYSHMTVAAISPAGANVALKLRKFKMEVNNNLFKEKYRLTGAGKRAGFGRAGQRTVSFEAEIEYEADDVLDYFKDGSSFDLEFRWVNVSKTLVITTPAGYFQGSRPGASDSGPIYLTMQYDAVMYSANNDELTFVLNNTTSSV